MTFLLAILFVGSFATAQEVPNTTFRTQATTVLVPALVRDKTGEPVYGLSAKDFLIEDDGVAQAVALDEAAESEPVSLVVAIQCGRRAGYELDRMKGLPAMLQPLLAQPQSTVALIAFDSQVHLIEDFTADQDAVQKDLRALRPGDGGAAILDAVSESVRLLEQVPQNRKRVLLLISETRDHGSHSAKVNDVIRAIGNSNTVVYTLAFSPSKSNVLDTLRGANNPDFHPEQTEMQAQPDLAAPVVLLIEAMRKNSAREIASLSGGEYEMFTSRHAFEARMTDFTNHLHSRYLLSFQPAHPHSGLHQLTVRLKQPGNATVLARNSYWAVETQP